MVSFLKLYVLLRFLDNSNGEPNNFSGILLNGRFIDFSYRAASVEVAEYNNILNRAFLGNTSSFGRNPLQRETAVRLIPTN